MRRPDNTPPVPPGYFDVDKECAYYRMEHLNPLVRQGQIRKKWERKRIAPKKNFKHPRYS